MTKLMTCFYTDSKIGMRRDPGALTWAGSKGNSLKVVTPLPGESR